MRSAHQETQVFGRLFRVLLFFILFTNHVIAAPAQAAADEYDYIVIGSGPGGGPVAVNLAKAGYSVLILEAGDTSVATGSNQYPPSITWDFFVKHYEEDEKNKRNNFVTWRARDGSYWVGNKNVPSDAKLLGIYYPRGATVGGSSMINAMATFLPTDSDWNYVVELTNDTTWAANNMRKVFESIEKNNYLPVGTPGHGFNGWFQTNMDKTTSVTGPIAGVLTAMANDLGQNPNQLVQLVSRDSNDLNPNRDTTVGIYGFARHARANGQRYSSRDYITEAINTRQFPLTLSQNSLATKIIFDTSGGKPKAKGVEYLVGKSLYKADARHNPNGPKGDKRTATARREVILSGGTFNSPQLLKLSGIGPAEELRKFNIPVLVDSPGVGTNMQDNQEMPVVGSLRSQAGGFGSGGCVMYKTQHAPYGERDMFLMQGPYAFRGFWPSNQSNAALPVDPAGTYGVSMVRQHPQNRAGTVKLLSANPQDVPEINFNLFKQGREADMGAMKDVVAWVRRIYAKVAGPSGPITPREPPCPNIQASGVCSDPKVDESWIEAQTFGHHPTSTCAIGSDGNKNAVLDSKFRVRGVDGLRVVDASAFPRIPGVFPVVATFMISQKASDTILAELKG
ncbi:choline dehydrogenase [Colletotrichum truncatum]|uniref:Choline dehydrogenase n=1 Tax=Colletotrichum truncatum TaxID=5467 RepID=A0ACC3Z996_COLTU|nr:choline dehydrogenase [Colletotrichum truncatum]KAF6793506.1 choline dehydrogenase [Colletotrichum truncatum]